MNKLLEQYLELEKKMESMYDNDDPKFEFIFWGKNTGFTTKGGNRIRTGFEGIYNKGGSDYETEIFLCCCR